MEAFDDQPKQVSREVAIAPHVLLDWRCGAITRLQIFGGQFLRSKVA